MAPYWQHIGGWTYALKIDLDIILVIYMYAFSKYGTLPFYRCYFSFNVLKSRVRLQFHAHSSYLINSFIFIHKLDFSWEDERWQDETWNNTLPFIVDDTLHRWYRVNLLGRSTRHPTLYYNLLQEFKSTMSIKTL